MQASAVYESTECDDVLCAICPNDKTLVTAGTSTVMHALRTTYLILAAPE